MVNAEQKHSDSLQESSHPLCLTYEDIMGLHAAELARKFPPKPQRLSRPLLVVTLAAWGIGAMVSGVNMTRSDDELQAAAEAAYAELSACREAHRAAMAKVGPLLQAQEKNKGMLATKEHELKTLESAIEGLKQQLARRQGARDALTDQLLRYVRVLLQARATGATEVLNAVLHPTMERRQELLASVDKERAAWQNRSYSLCSVALSGDKIQVIYQYDFVGRTGREQGYGRELWTMAADGTLYQWRSDRSPRKPAHSPGFKIVYGK